MEGASVFKVNLKVNFFKYKINNSHAVKQTFEEWHTND